MIFNAEEYGLFFSLLLGKTYAFKDESAMGASGITVLVCSNMDGSENMSLLVTLKSEKPR
jgi:hypothetical protein